MSEVERVARCNRCGAPASKGVDKGGKLIALRGYRRTGRLGAHRRPSGYVHADRGFCERRMPAAVRAARKASR